MRPPRSIAILLTGALGVAALSACQVELRRVNVREERLKAIDQAQREDTPELTIVHEDGSVTLNSPRPEHLVMHLRQHIVQGSIDLIHDQLLAQEAKRIYSDQGLDSHDAVHWLVANQRDVLILLNRMTSGISSPDVLSQPMGNGWRLRIAPHLERAFRFTTLDMIRENGQFKLLLIS